MDAALHQFSETLLGILKQMDSEANVSKDGYPTGLAWYGGYFRPDCKRPPTETSWTQRLSQLLTEAGIATKAECRYPGQTRCKCDNVVQLSDGRRLWMENKGAWKEYWRSNGGLGIYRSYLFHPLLPGLDPKTHTVPLDL